MRFIQVLLLLVGLSATMVAEDNAFVRGFWQRYSKHPSPAFRDTIWQQKEWERDLKKVRLIYDVDFDTYFDNREYRSEWQTPQTIFAFRLSPMIGVRIKDNIGGDHSLKAGVRYTQPLGGDWKDAKVIPTAYYHYHYQGVNLQLGAIPFENRIWHLPDWLQYDSISYARANIQGALMSYQDKRGYVEFMCDWRGAQTMDRREMFRLLVDGQYQYKWFFVGGLAHLNHTAGTANDAVESEKTLYDDLNLGVHTGFDFTRLTPLDSLAIKATYICGMQRNRTINEVYYPQGVLIEIYANWWFLGVKNTTYVGQNLQPLRNEDNGGQPIGSLLCQGDPFYQAKLYNRTDVFAYLYRSSFVDCYLSYNLHYDGNRLQHQQQVFVRFSLDGLMHEQQGQYLRGLFDK